MKKPSTEVFIVKRDVTCIQCGAHGAVQSYGKHYQSGLGEDYADVRSLEEYVSKPYLSRTMGFGGTIPYRCLNCNNSGLIDCDGLEGYKLAFITKPTPTEKD